MAEEETTQVENPNKKQKDTVSESRIFNITVRGWLALLFVITVCIRELGIVAATVFIAIKNDNLSTLTNSIVGEPLYSLSVAAVGFYFGQQVNRQVPQQKTS